MLGLRWLTDRITLGLRARYACRMDRLRALRSTVDGADSSDRRFACARFVRTSLYVCELRASVGYDGYAVMDSSDAMLLRFAGMRLHVDSDCLCGMLRRVRQMQLACGMRRLPGLHAAADRLCAVIVDCCC